jgi:undecaprenyl diphosphate synthase
LSLQNPPKHIAIIMDGNRRWAKNKGLAPLMGHKKGYERFKEIADYCIEIGIRHLTVYAFSTENWKRSEDEVKGLMDLLRFGIKTEQKRLASKDFQIKVIGRKSDLPQDIQEAIYEVEKNTAGNTSGVLNIAISYGGKAEVVDAVNEALKAGATEITENIITENLYTLGQPDPDLIIRTGGEHRLSNFLLWQSSYAELYFTDTLWPDFSPEELDKAIEFFVKIKRNFGK